MLGQILVTKQTGPEGKIVRKVRLSHLLLLCVSNLNCDLVPVVLPLLLWTLSSARFISARNQSEIESQPDYVI
jgi:hypothetical protein